MAQDPTSFTPTEPLSSNGDIWQMRDWFKNVIRWAKRLCGVAVSQTASFTADDNMFFPVNATSGAVVVTLPTAATWTPGKPYIIKKTDSSTNTVTVSRTGSDTIDGATSVVIRAQYAVYQFLSDGVTTWHLVQGSVATPLGYTEGTFTPAWGATVTPPTLTYTLQTGSYTKVGRLCFFHIRIAVNVLTAGGAGQLTLTGLPFSIASDGQGQVNVNMANAWVASPTGGLLLSGGGTVINMYKSFNLTAQPPTDLASGCDFWLNGWYKTA